MNNISQGLLQTKNFKIKILTLNTFKHPLNVGILPEDYLVKTNIQTVFIDTRIKFIDVLMNFFSGKSYNVTRFYSKEFERMIEATLQKDDYDIVHLESLFVTPYLDIIRKNSKAKIIYRAHNLEFEIWKELAGREKNFLKKKYLGFLSGRIKNYETGLLNEFDGIASISKDNMNKIYENGCKIPVENIPFGINISEYQNFRIAFSPKEFPSQNAYPNLFFLGSMDWLPNREGLDWFLENTWKRVQKNNPGLKFLIAGKAMPDNYYRLKIPNTEILGEVSDAKKFMLENGIMVVPLLSGSGIRVKIVEAMALGKVIIATSLAAKGIGCEHKKNILLCDSPEEFAEMIFLAVSQKELRIEISSNAQKFAEENYDNRKITEKLVAFYKEIINRF